MNYIWLLNSYSRWCRTNYLPGSAELLWYKLADLFNASGWEEWVSVDTQTLMGLVRISDRSSLIKSRNYLIEAGLLEYVRGKKGTPGRYKILCGNFQHNVQQKNQNNDEDIPKEKPGDGYKISHEELSLEEKDILVKEYGMELVNQKIENAKKYHNCFNYSTIKNWCELEKGKKPSGKNQFNNFHQREYDYDALESALLNKDREL